MALIEQLQKLEGKTLVFVKTKRKTDELQWDLNRSNIKADAIHGDKYQGERD